MTVKLRNHNKELDERAEVVKKYDVAELRRRMNEKLGVNKPRPNMWQKGVSYGVGK